MTTRNAGVWGHVAELARSAATTCASMPLALFMVFFLMAQSVVMVYHSPLGYPPDEIPHLSYVRDAIVSPYALPNYSDGKVMGTTQGNYLSHPPVYYTALAVVGKVFRLDPKADYLVFRWIGVLFVGAGLLCMVLLGKQLQLEQTVIAAALLGCAATPMFTYAAGSVSNDTLLYFGVAASLYGFAHGLNPANASTDARQRWSLAALLLGLTVTFLTKATGIAFLVFFTGFLALLQFTQVRIGALLARSWQFVAIFLLVVGGYFVSTRLAHGAFFPRAADLYELAPPAELLNFWGYAREFFATMWRRLPAIMSHLSVAPIPERLAPVFHTMLVTPLVAWVVVRCSSAIRITDRARVHFFDAMALAAVATIALHLYLGWRVYLGNGVLSGLQPRYYTYLLPPMWFAVFAICRPGWFRQAVLLVFAGCALVVFWASAPFVLTKQQEALNSRPQNLVYAAPAAGAELAVTTRLRDEVTGNVDDFDLSNGLMRARGWVFDTRDGTGVERLWVITNNRFLVAVKVQALREDVVTATGNPQAQHAGFFFTLRQVDAALKLCDFRLLAEYRDGSFGRLMPKTCAIAQ